MNKQIQEQSIPIKKIDDALEELQKMVEQKVFEVDNRISSERCSASEFYIADMKGFSRGLHKMGIEAIAFLKQKLKKKD